MSSAASLVYLQYGNTRNKSFSLRGKDWVRGTAVILSGGTNVTITNIPNLSPGSVVRIIQQKNGGTTAKFINIKANSVYGNLGTILVGSKNGSPTTSDTPFMFEVQHY